MHITRKENHIWTNYVYIWTLGCRLNEALSNGNAVSQILFCKRTTPNTSEPFRTTAKILKMQMLSHSIHAVTVEAEKSRRRIRFQQKTNPQAKTVVTGCYVHEPQKLSRDLEVDLIVPNKEKDILPQKS